MLEGIRFRFGCWFSHRLCPAVRSIRGPHYATRLDSQGRNSRLLDLYTVCGKTMHELQIFLGDTNDSYSCSRRRTSFPGLSPPARDAQPRLSLGTERMREELSLSSLLQLGIGLLETLLRPIIS